MVRKRSTGLNRFEAVPMGGTGPELLEPLEVGRGRVTFVNMKLIFWEPFMVPIHQVIPKYLGQDGRRGNG